MGAEKQAVILLIAVQAGIGEVRAQDAADVAMTVDERLESIENVLSNRGLLELVQQVQNLEMEISRLRGEAEVQNHTLEQLKKRQRDLYTDIDRRIRRVEGLVTPAVGGAAGETEPPLQTLSPFRGTEETGGQQAETPLTLELVARELAPGSAAGEGIVLPVAPPDRPEEPASDPEIARQQIAGDGFESVPGPGVAGTQDQEPAVSGTSGDVVAEASIEVVPERIEEEYRNAFNLLKQLLYDQAVTAFREFLERHPGNEYADRARFWLAEAYYVNGYFEQALVEYNALVRQHPESRKLSQAKLKAAFCRYELGQVESAGRQLEEIIQQYPGTTVAGLAQDRLKQMTTVPVPGDMVPAD